MEEPFPCGMKQTRQAGLAKLGAHPPISLKRDTEFGKTAPERMHRISAQDMQVLLSFVFFGNQSEVGPLAKRRQPRTHATGEYTLQNS